MPAIAYEPNLCETCCRSGAKRFANRRYYRGLDAYAAFWTLPPPGRSSFILTLRLASMSAASSAA